MDKDNGNWEDQSQKDIPEPPRINDPFAELWIELVLCEMALEIGRGAFCDWCECQLGFHCGMDDGVCELCGCLGQHTTPDRQLTHIIPSVLDAATGRRMEFEGRPYKQDFRIYNRAEEARKVLKELTE